MELKPTAVNEDHPRAFERLVYYINERESIRKLREAGYPKPWTQDKILQTYRFCNVNREDDTVTQWIAKHWREPNAKDKDLWLAMVVARLINWPDTLYELDYPHNLHSTDRFVNWGRKFLHTLHSRKAQHKKVFSGAYIVSTNGHIMDKADYLLVHVIRPMWDKKEFLRPQQTDSLASFAYRLTGFNGMGGFMAGQVIADLKYAKGCPLYTATDWATWALSGPGSRRGLNRLLGREKNAPWKEEAWHEQLYTLQKELKRKDITLHAQDVQNNLCEFDKYERVRLGTGRPRSLYPGV